MGLESIELHQVVAELTSLEIQHILAYQYVCAYYTKVCVCTQHSDLRALVLCDLILSTSANPTNTGRAAVQCTEQLLCLCWLDWQTLKESVTQHPTPAAHCVNA